MARRCELLGALLCAALRCAALSLSIIGFGFSHSSILRSGPEPPHLPNLPLSPRPAALSSPTCRRRSWLLPTVFSQSWLSACSSSKPPSFRPCLPRTKSRRLFHPPRSSTSLSHPSLLDNCLRPHRSYQAPERSLPSLDSLSLVPPLHTAASLSLERLGPAFCASHHSLPASRLPPLFHTALVASNGRELSTETEFTCKNSTVTIAVAATITALVHILESLGST